MTEQLPPSDTSPLVPAEVKKTAYVREKTYTLGITLLKRSILTGSVVVAAIRQLLQFYLGILKIIRVKESITATEVAQVKTEVTDSLIIGLWSEVLTKTKRTRESRMNARIKELTGKGVGRSIWAVIDRILQNENPAVSFRPVPQVERVERVLPERTQLPTMEMLLEEDREAMKRMSQDDKIFANTMAELDALDGVTPKKEEV